MKMRMVDYLMDRIYDAGAHHVFFVPGTGCMFLTDALARKRELTAVSVHHEQAAGMAALTYAKLGNPIGACVVTTGCGGTNAMTALLNAWQDSVPCVFISGQAARHQTVRNCGLPLRQMGRQEADIIALVSPITKYAVMFNDVNSVAAEIDKALYLATSGRPGPVWLDVPMDIQNYMIETDDQARWSPTHSVSVELRDDARQYILNALASAKRPVLLAGNGIRLAKAEDAFLRFVEKYQIPVVYTRLGHDLIPSDHPLSIGMVGMLGASRAGNFAAANSDLLLVMGSRLSIDTTGYEYEKFAREAKVVVVDIDEIEHAKNTVKIDKFIHANIGFALEALIASEAPRVEREWCEKCAHWKSIFPVCIGESHEGDRINMYHFTSALSEVLPENATVISDAGNSFFTVSPVIRTHKGQRSITSGAQAEMGYALPAAIGAAYAREGVVIPICGDGSVMMNLQELETLVFLKPNVKLFIMNNNGYSSIRHLQDNAFRGRQIGCDPTSGISFPSFEKIAMGFGLPYVKISGYDDLPEKIAAVLKMKGPVVSEVMCVEKQPFITVACAFNSKHRMVNRPLEDQAPFIDRELFKQEMIITPLD